MTDRTTIAWLYVIAGAALAALAVMAYGAPMQHWLAPHLGIGTGPVALYWYSLWSGIVGDLGYLAIVGGLITTARHHNCGVKGCWRLHRFEYEADGVTHKVCHHHHPALGKEHRLTHTALVSHHVATRAAQASRE